MLKEKPYPSGETVVGPERSGTRGYLYALGLESQDLEKPFIIFIWGYTTICGLLIQM